MYYVSKGGMSDDDIEFCMVQHDVGQVVELGGAEPLGGAPDIDWHTRLFGVAEARATHGVDGTGVRVAVIDTGVNHSHPGLAGSVTAHDCTGFGPGDENGHGSHCCGVVHSVAPGAEIHSFRVFEPKNTAVIRNIMEALRRIASGELGKFDIVSMSLGGGAPSHEMRMALLELTAKGVIVCCAAGNEGDHEREGAPRFGTVNYPAHFSSTIAVGSLDKQRRRSQFSSSGPKITVMAPGENVWSCWKDNGLACLSGTSMATPFVAGTLALLFHACLKNKISKPTLSQLIFSMARSSADMEEPGFDFFTGYGCINPPGMIQRYLDLAVQLRSTPQSACV